MFCNNNLIYFLANKKSLKQLSLQTFKTVSQSQNYDISGLNILALIPSKEQAIKPYKKPSKMRGIIAMMKMFSIVFIWLGRFEQELKNSL